MIDTYILKVVAPNETTLIVRVSLDGITIRDDILYSNKTNGTIGKSTDTERVEVYNINDWMANYSPNSIFDVLTQDELFLEVL